MNGPAVPEKCSKGEFARLIGVTAGRISQYIADGQLKPDAFDGEGRDAKVIVAVACKQLKKNLDISQRLGNGINTRLDQASAATPPPSETLPLMPPATGASPPADNSVEEQIKRARLRQLELNNRRSAEEAAQRSGVLTNADAVRQAQGRAFARLVAGFEGSLADFATAISNRFGLQQRDVLHELKMEWRNVRARTAKQLKDEASDVPEMVAVELDVPAVSEDQTEDAAA